MPHITPRQPQWHKKGRSTGQVRSNASHAHSSVPAALAFADFQRLVDGWLLDAGFKRQSPRTMQTKREIAGKLQWWMADQGVAELDTLAMRRFFAYCGSTGGGKWGRADYNRTKPISAATVDTYHVYLQSFFNWAVSEDLLAVSPMAKISRPDLRSVPGVVPLSPKQIGSILDAAKFGPFPERDQALVMFFLDTGVRVTECCNAKIADVDRTEKTVHVIGKGGKPRIVRFGKETSMALWRYLRVRSDGGDDKAPLFIAHGGNHSGSALTRNGMLTIIKQLGADAGITTVRVSPHTLRHSFAAMMLEGGANIVALRQLLGHRSIKTTNRYVAELQSHLAAQHVAAGPVDNLRRKSK